MLKKMANSPNKTIIDEYEPKVDSAVYHYCAANTFEMRRLSE